MATCTKTRDGLTCQLEEGHGPIHIGPDGGEWRMPLRALAPEERTAVLDELGLGEDLLPKNATDAERLAAQPVVPGEAMPEAPAVPVEAPAEPPRKAIIPEKWAKWTGLLGFGMGLAAFLPIPPPWGVVIGLSGGALSLLSGGALPQFKFMAGRTWLTGGWLLAASVALEEGVKYVMHLPPGLPQNLGILAINVLCFLTGKGAWQPTKKA